MTPAAPSYTAAQLAAALCITGRAVALRLDGIAPDACAIVRGKTSKAWSFNRLPQFLQAELQSTLKKRGLASLDELFAHTPQAWQPAVSWSDLPAPARERAGKLVEAFADALQRQHDLTGPALMELAAVRYRQTFGAEIKEDRLRYILDRAIKRDRGVSQWHRPELYLEERDFERNTTPAPVPAAINAALHPVVSELKNRVDPTSDDRSHLFHAAFQLFEKLCASSPRTREIRAAKNAIVQYLHASVPGLYRPQTGRDAQPQGKALLAIRRVFDLKYTAWARGGRIIDSVKDERRVKSGRKGYACPDCEKLIRSLAAKHRGARAVQGNVDNAIRILINQEELCPSCMRIFRKGVTSSTIRLRITPNALQVASFKGPEFIRKHGPTKHCDWSDSAPGDRFVIDDMTTDEEAWEEYEDGTIDKGQVQLLYTEDEHSGYPLPFLMYFGPPSGITIKKELALVLTNMGLPHVGLITERGVFNNKMLSGERRKAGELSMRDLLAGLGKHIGIEDLSDDELDAIRTRQLGLRDPAFGLRIHQATSPQAKTVERSFYEIQKQASLLPGFCGFNQRNEKPKRLQEFDRRVKSGKEHPGNEYPRLSDLRAYYEGISADLAGRAINGIRHRGRSPKELWLESISRRPLRKLPEEIEALLKTHRIPDVKINADGIRIRLNKFEAAFYYNDWTGQHINERVTVLIDYDMPQCIFVEVPRSKLTVKIERAFIRRHTATAEELAKANNARRAHISGSLAEVGNVDTIVANWITRDRDHHPRDMRAGRVVIETQRQEEAAQAAREDGLARVETLARECGDNPANIRNLDAYAESKKRENAIRAKWLAKEKKA